MGEYTLKGICLIFILAINFSLAQEDPKQFFPSSVGNVWEYDTPSGINTYRVVKDSILQDSSRYIYYEINSDPVYRIDTSFNVFWIPTDSLLNWHYYELNSDIGDHWMVRPETSEVPRMEALVRSKYTSIFLGHQTTIMEITFYDLNWGDTVINQYSWPRFTESLAYGIGEVLYFDEEGGGPQRVLQGCIIDGDTIGIITTAKETEKIKPVEFKLFQNYPNPFNPATTIPYRLKEGGYVKLYIYDIKGELVTTLVNQWQNKGYYEVVFRPTAEERQRATGMKVPMGPTLSDMASGVYLYQIMVTSDKNIPVFSDMGKMILLK